MRTANKTVFTPYHGGNRSGATSKAPNARMVNTDVLPTSREVVYLDATRRFPLKTNIDYVCSEHMIEHIEHQCHAKCFRVLKPVGKIRMRLLI
jgi:predicted SAM-dependent methyltransferase